MPADAVWFQGELWTRQPAPSAGPTIAHIAPLTQKGIPPVEKCPKAKVNADRLGTFTGDVWVDGFYIELLVNGPPSPLYATSSRSRAGLNSLPIKSPAPSSRSYDHAFHANRHATHTPRRRPRHRSHHPARPPPSTPAHHPPHHPPMPRALTAYLAPDHVPLTHVPIPICGTARAFSTHHQPNSMPTQHPPSAM